MLLIQTAIRPSRISGLGLFANQNIPKGTKVWIFKENFDIELTSEQIQLLPPIAQEHVKTYSYLSKTNHLYIYPTDNGKFINHSKNPNLTVVFTNESPQDINVAARHILCGEELTLDYEMFDQEFPTYKDSFKEK